MKGRLRDAARWALALVGCLPSAVQAQLGVTVCACQPSVYTFQLDFNALCDVGTIDSRPGIRGADCFARGIGLYADDTEDFVPVQVTSISIIETNRQFQVIAQSPYSSSFFDGDKITYTSILGTPGGIASLDETNVPAGMQVDIVGINALEQPITNVWIILFDNLCGVFPVLERGDKIGWTIIDDIRLPYQSVCPIAGSVAPTLSPKSPTLTPSRTPAALPAVEEPSTSYPSDAPSEAPYEEAVPVCVPSGHGKSGKSSRSTGKGGTGKGESSGKSGQSRSSGKGGGTESDKNDELRDTSSDETITTVRDFYRFGVVTRGVGHGSRPVDNDGDESDSRDSGKGKGVSHVDDDDECLPPKKKKDESEKSSAKKLTKIGTTANSNGKGKAGKGASDKASAGSSSKGKSGHGKSGSADSGKGDKQGGKAGTKLTKKLPSRSEKQKDKLEFDKSGKGKSSKSGGGKAGMGKSGKSDDDGFYLDGKGSVHSGKGGKGGKAGSRLAKKVEIHSPSRSEKLTKEGEAVAHIMQKDSQSVVRAPAARPVAAAEALSSSSSLSPVKSPTTTGATSAPSLPTGSLNMVLLESRINHWFQKHNTTEQKTDGEETDRRRLRR